MPPQRSAKRGGGDRLENDDKRATKSSNVQDPPSLTKGNSMVGRPHTRAFTRSQSKLTDKQRIPDKQSNQILLTQDSKFKRPYRKAAGSAPFNSKKTRETTQPHGRSQTITRRTSREPRTASKKSPKALSNPKNNSRRQVRNQPPARSTEPSVSRWLESLPENPSLPFEEVEMTSSTSRSITTEVFSQTPAASTVKNKKTRHISLKTYLEQLQDRKADPSEKTEDNFTAKIRLYSQLPQRLEIPFRDTDKLVAHAKEFIQKCRNRDRDANSYKAIEDFKHKFNQELADKLFTITNEDFQHDLDRARNTNEALFQRTVLLSIIDRWRLREEFDYDCEELWSARNYHPLPTTNFHVNDLPRQKPDLTIYFTRVSIGQNLPKYTFIPSHIRSCMFPDSKLNRCFPFLFIEVKRKNDPIEKAQYDGMLAASQALYNIYQCMKQLGQTRKFYQEVRVFSIAMNAHVFSARIHRAKGIAGEEGPEFLFDDITNNDGSKYGRDQVSLLIRSILTHYASPKLLPILQKTYHGLYDHFKNEKMKTAPDTSSARYVSTTVPRVIDSEGEEEEEEEEDGGDEKSDEEDEASSQQSKRRNREATRSKSRAVRERPSKRTRSSKPNLPPTTGNSFDLDNLQMDNESE